ncbi:MAG: homoserine dehydrogenase [Lactobacillus sp.]|jgi:homoserine dehydrogenase|nr:homoserine dehydrogenase [Lactobacillus sp.]MCH3906089.1 homoserine dehydrogenase [Lactobacillus sp.]MCH3990336.1 homoserine dehydrogenase [Lactobacillus sp.]MCH4068949.1 homoserine dehydrogenase [Lactobacillus sp.]MCI1303351.1 homoserine dehydrogenase [Lactobacillus sp.]
MMQAKKVALLGLGTVGSGVLQILINNQAKIVQNAGCQLVPVKALVRNPAKHKEAARQIKLVTDFDEILHDPEIELVVEVMGGLHPAKEFISQLLQAKKSVITANKDLIASCGPELVKLAEENQVALRYEASVAGGIPILNALTHGFAGDEITQVAGIVNGTTNYILTQMSQQHMSFASALEQAQKLGFAEADPTNDVTGKDAAFKMVILSKFAFGTDIKVTDFHYEGIQKLQSFDVEQAAQLGYTIKLLGISRKIGAQLFVEVAPALVPANSQLAQVDNEYNAVAVQSEAAGTSLFYGPGAGSLPTANSVVSDLIAASRTQQPFNLYNCQLSLAAPSSVIDPYYVSMIVPVTTAPAIVSLLAQHQIKAADVQAVDDQAGHHLVIQTEPVAQQSLVNFKQAAEQVGAQVTTYRILAE